MRVMTYSEQEEREREEAWYDLCVERAQKCEPNSVLHQVWWSLRMEDVRKWDGGNSDEFQKWAEYLAYKIEDQVIARRTK